jgi:hypothetical protein
MAARIYLTDQQRKVPYKPRGGNSSKGRIRGPQPQSWISGPDPRRHDQYIAWLRHKAQAAFRKEAHELTFEQWETFWNTDWAWENRGTSNVSVILTRIDSEKAWSFENCHIVDRVDHLREKVALTQTGRKYKKRKKL